MSRFTQVKTEYANGTINGVDYGSKVRVVMRSPTAVIFVGYGLNSVHRNDRYRSNKIAIDSKKATVEKDHVRTAVIELFGEDSHEWLVKAISTRGMGTILVDGGGDALPIPRLDSFRLVEAEYEKITPSMNVPLEGLKTCIQCGSDLKPVRVSHTLGTSPKDGHPKTIEECQKLTNRRVISISGFDKSKPSEWWSYISYFYTWDGESYQDDTFCNDRCAATYGRRAAAELPLLQTGGDAPKVNRPKPEYFDHSPKRDKTMLDGFIV